MFYISDKYYSELKYCINDIAFDLPNIHFAFEMTDFDIWRTQIYFITSYDRSYLSGIIFHCRYYLDNKRGAHWGQYNNLRYYQGISGHNCGKKNQSNDCSINYFKWIIQVCVLFCFYFNVNIPNRFPHTSSKLESCIL